MNINTLFSGKNTARQRLGTKAPMRLGFHMWHFTHFTQSNFNPFKISFKIFPTSHEPESSTVDFYHPWIWFPIAGWHFQDPIYVWWLPIIYGFLEWFKGRFTGTRQKMMGNTMVSDRFSLNFPSLMAFLCPANDVLRSIYTASTCSSRCRSEVPNTGGFYYSFTCNVGCLCRLYSQLTYMAWFVAVAIYQDVGFLFPATFINSNQQLTFN